MSDDDEPQGIMSHDPRHRMPMYDHRIGIWEDTLAAHEHVSHGMSFYGHAVSNWNDGNYEASAQAFEAAGDRYAEARRIFADARERADLFKENETVETVATDDLISHLNRLTERMEAAEGFAASMRDGSDTVRAGDDSASSAHVTEANRLIGEYNEIGPTELRDIAVALGLVRGFDRDENIAEAEENEVET